jgi:hypothetical protein
MLYSNTTICTYGNYAGTYNSLGDCDNDGQLKIKYSNSVMEGYLHSKSVLVKRALFTYSHTDETLAAKNYGFKNYTFQNFKYNINRYVRTSHCNSILADNLELLTIVYTG